MRGRIAFLTLVLVAPVEAAEDYESILWEALHMESDLRPGEEPDEPIDRAFRRIGDAIEMAPERWEAYMARGLNRVQKTVVVRRILANELDRLRGQGAPVETVEFRRQAGEGFIDICLAAAYENFRLMERQMQLRGIRDPDRVTFANAAMKYAKAEYLSAARGARGAIQDFEHLIARGYQTERCSNMIARCYNEHGVAMLRARRYAEAQESWSRGLDYVRDAELRRTLLTNKAGGYELDNEFGLAEDILRKLVADDPNRPVHWKNLGLLLGYQGRLREALEAYARARELCHRTEAPFFLGMLHGNAWLRAATIHGKLLEEDGDLRTAWRLLLEYRANFGDDYNFSLAFGDFAAYLGQYDLAWRFLEHARKLYSFCPKPLQLMMQIAPRAPGAPDEVRERIERLKEELRVVEEQFDLHPQSDAMVRTCGGLRDLADEGGMPGVSGRLEPDPLEGLDENTPPDWLLDAAARRRPFRPFDPAIDVPPEPETPGEPSAAPEPEPRKVPYAILALGLVLVAAVVVLLRFGRRRGARAS